MSYEVLARKLRPSGFDALVGQEHVVRALSHALDNGRLHHAYLFTGTRGVGKTTIARILAKSLNCETGVSSMPCGECSICLEVKENRFIDLIEVDAASRTGVDDTRELLENAQYMPARGRYKVYLIDEVHMLSMASFNALLKTLEEPPEHVKFLLATTDPKKVPVTVLSRCLQFQLKNISPQIITEYIAGVLATEEVVFETPAIEVIARSAEGSMRDALSLTDQAIAFGQGKLLQADVVTMLGVVGRDEVTALLQALSAGSAEHILALTAELAERNADFADVLKGLLEALHSMAVDIALKPQTNDFAADELQLYYQIALVGLRDLPIVPDQRSGFEMTLLRMLAFAPQGDSKVPPRANTQGVSEGDTSSAAAMTSQSVQVTGASVNATAVDTNNSGSDGAAATPQADEATPEQPEAEKKTSELAPAPAKAAQEPEEEREEEPEKKQAVDQNLEEGDWPVTISGDALIDWHELVKRLTIGGVARMIAEHSVPLSFALPNVALLLSSQHDMLLSDAQVVNLARGLSEVCDQTVNLTVEVGNVGEETPSVYRARLAHERQISAEQSLQQDETVKRLLADFGGSIDEVKPA
ncbi:MAG: DNA polymerase III subunit gamma/tau [Pseudomonadales bacterium]|nr:DNA polymerase III subunit gamma/tau [Pseudomonadales bacterium]